jgi:hypothetical protein
MTPDEVRLLDGFSKKEGWLEPTQQQLFDTWRSTTGHQPDASSRTWACEIANHCRTCDEHLSLPCSLLQEANEIGEYLQAPCYAE